MSVTERGILETELTSLAIVADDMTELDGDAEGRGFARCFFADRAYCSCAHLRCFAALILGDGISMTLRRLLSIK